MKIIRNRALWPALALSFMLVIPAAAVESEPAEQAPSATERSQDLPREIVFQIPMNNYCSTENPLDFSLQLTNAADTAADITLFLYHRDGSAYSEEGGSYLGIESTLLPGTPFTLPGYATNVYHVNFGNHKRCSERVYLGRIVANSGRASLLARGWVTTKDGMKVTGTEAIVINDNRPFDLSGSN